MYKAVTELPIRSRLLLAAAADRDVTPLAVVLRHETQRQLDCDAAARDQRLCIIGSSLLVYTKEKEAEQQLNSLERAPERVGNGCNAESKLFRANLPVQTGQTS